jgi:peptide/nickel transport system permease protein
MSGSSAVSVTTFNAGPARRAAELAGTRVEPATGGTAQADAPARSQLQEFVQGFREHRAAWVSTWVLLAMAATCVLLPLVLPWNPTQIDYAVLDARAPSLAHPLGTDTLGRDVLARLVNAGRVSLLIGLMVALFAASVGALVGITAGYFGGRVDASLMWLVNVLLTIPSLPLLIALSAVAAGESGDAARIFRAVPPEWRIIVIMAALGWMAISRVVRSQVITLRRQEFVEAAEALGASHARIMGVHILPNTVSVLAVFTTLTVSTAILSESTLSFLGVGVALPTATWGNMLNEARDVFIVVEYWWLAWFPALAILLTVLCVNFIGDGMRDAFDPKARK